MPVDPSEKSSAPIKYTPSPRVRRRLVRATRDASTRLGRRVPQTAIIEAALDRETADLVRIYFEHQDRLVAAAARG